MGRRHGFTLIELMIVIAIISIIAAIAIPNMMAARMAGNETSAVGALKTIASAETMFNEGDRESDGNLDYGMLSELSNVTLVDSVLGSGTKAGFFFQVTYSFLSSEYLWFGTANPSLPTLTGERYFSVNMGGAIFYTSANSLNVDTNTCVLPNNGVIVTGK
jgi:prepilin-type N-terminal cleavage/methylation domain-containing protein